ncbi:hypothetical protein AVEN_31521-1 [Araneus ventricosus]|uniref:Uncharacterized protein n=1 Tax=Araneus ventricosus TaxID=182803 RepID=A0A4Y2JLG7_ARAVE|nr:hypothetical protein AVEN_31521-1 [Araneus ventricosus]
MYTGLLAMNNKTDIVTNMESRFPAMLVLWLGREFYKVKHGLTGSGCSGIPDLGDHFGDLATNLATCRCLWAFLFDSMGAGAGAGSCRWGFLCFPGGLFCLTPFLGRLARRGYQKKKFGDLGD